MVVACGPSTTTVAQGQQPTGYVVVDEFDHDPEAFTQGLDFKGESLFESTGLNGQSTLRKVDLESGRVLRQIDVADRHFAEGITVLGKRIFQITWKSEVAFVYRPSTFKRIDRFPYKGEGWGLTHDGEHLIMSDGSSIIRFRDPKTFKVVRRLPVTDGGQPVEQLNELEWIDGEIFANVWQTADVVRIDPSTGEVTGRLDLGPLWEMEKAEGEPDVPNGIAYLTGQDRLFVTGKNWAHLYEIRLTD